MIDVVVALVMLAYAASGYRQGLLVGTLSLGGFLAGAVLGIAVIPDLADRLEPSLQRSMLVLAAVLVTAWLGQVIGSVVGTRLRRGVVVGPIRSVDHALGGVVGLVAVALVVWFVGGALRASPSPGLSRAVASSRILSAVDGVMPAQFSALAQNLRTTVEGSAFPRVFAGVGLEQIAPVQGPNPAAMSADTLAVARRSIVKITGEATACNRGQEGSGSVVAAGRVITNAHVVAGVQEPFVQVGGVGRRYPATVVLFDPERDLAVLAVPGLAAPSLPMGKDLGRAADAVVAGFPRNGPFTPVAARVRQVLQASGEDIYGRPGVVREVYSLFAKVEPGNSGGPVLGVDGTLVGIVFAKSLDDANTGYALTMAEAQSDIVAGIAARGEVSTQNCAVG